MFVDLFTTNLEELASVVVASTLVLGWALVAIRLGGLRSLAKMSGFDFVVTIGLGTIVGSVAAGSIKFWSGVLSFAMLLTLQWVIAQLRRRTSLEDLVDNQPMLLMEGPHMIEENLTKARVTRSDVYAKLREANVTDMSDVLAVVLETTGDVSVLHGSGTLDDTVLTGVARSDPPADP